MHSAPIAIPEEHGNDDIEAAPSRTDGYQALANESVSAERFFVRKPKIDLNLSLRAQSLTVGMLAQVHIVPFSHFFSLSQSSFCLSGG